jgi:hypothetical protein
LPSISIEPDLGKPDRAWARQSLGKPDKAWASPTKPGQARQSLGKETFVKYTIDIQGMHCSGCTKLVSMSLKDENLEAVSVDLATHSATFESDEKAPAVQAKIDRIAAELGDYQFASVREG